MKNNITYIVLLLGLFFASCKNDEPVPVSSLDVKNLEINALYTTADILWSVNSNATIDEVILEYSNDSSFVNSKEGRMNKVKDDLYIISLDSLTNGTTYYIRCRAINRVNSCASEAGEFSTLPYSLASVSTDSVNQIDVSSADIHATLLNRGTDKETIVGFYFASHPNVSEEDSCIIVALNEQRDSIEYSYSLSNLDDGVTYYVRAFAKNHMGTSYGEELSFVTTEMYPPSVGTTTIAYVSYTNAICSSEVITDGGGTITERGFCYATTQNPSIENFKVVSGSGIGTFSANIPELENGTTYFIRAYAKNNKGIVYGEQNSFTTKNYSLPVVTTSEVTKIKFTSAVCGGSVTADGGQTVTERGICFSTSPNPSISDNKISNGNGLGEYTCNLTDLIDGTTYYVRAYASNSIGTNYGEDVSFTTKAILPNAIYYSATEKLIETADNTSPGLHVYRFSASIISHTFEDGEGVIVFSDLITSIGDHAFYGCDNLYSIKIPNSVTNIETMAFYNCSNLQSIDMPNGIAEIGSSAFQGCLNMKSISIPSSVTSIGDHAFSGSGLISVSIPNGIKIVKPGLFYNCSHLLSVELPNSITSIGYSAFYQCSSLNNIIIPDNVTTIGYYAYYYCTSANTLLIGSRVSSIGERAFQGCKGLSSITCKPTTPPSCYNSQSYVFSEVSRATLLYVPQNSISAYQSASVWREFYNIFPITE